MLSNPNFRRSPRCGYYESEYVLKRNHSIPAFPVKHVAIFTNGIEKTLSFSQPFVLMEKSTNLTSSENLSGMVCMRKLQALSIDEFRRQEFDFLMTQRH